MIMKQKNVLLFAILMNIMINRSINAHLSVKKDGHITMKHLAVTLYALRE